MKISVITVVLNDIQGLKKTIESIRTQTSHDYESVIIDGISTDGTIEYLEEIAQKNWWKEHHFRYYVGKDTGIYNAMNKGVKYAKGNYCIFLNAGDTFVDNKALERASKQICDKDIYTGHIKMHGKHKGVNYAPFKLTLPIFVYDSLSHPSSFIRTQLLIDMPYNEDFKIVSDWEFFFKQYLKGATYKQLNFFVSNFYFGGFSSQHEDLIPAERSKVLKQLIPDYILREYQQADKLEYKVQRAFMQNPIQRDLKILRNVLKTLIRDLFYNGCSS